MERQESIRLAELIGSLSLATDLGMGQPMEQAMRTCLLSVKAGRELGLSNDDLSDTYYLALLRFVGCTGDAHEAARAAGGDEISDRAGVAPFIMADTREFLAYMVRDYAAGTPILTRIKLIAAALGEGSSGAKRSIAAHCEVAQMLAARMGLRDTVGKFVGSTFERWDGKGLPGELSEEAIPQAARLVSVARDVEVFHRMGGWPQAAHVLRKRKGASYDPSVVDVFLDNGEAWLAEADQGQLWESMLAAEPDPAAVVEPARLDDVLGAFADFVDLKSPFTLGHSPEVARLAATAARHAGLSTAEVEDVRRAGLVHDLGKTGIPNGIWDKAGPLSQGEWERVRLHPYLTERIFAQSPALRHIAQIAGAHHERVDGSGYHRGSAGPALPATGRILAAADVYQAMGQPRPYRPPLDGRTRAPELLAEVNAGRLDRDAVRCVLEASGQRLAPQKVSWPNGLTDREVEVLRLIARGASIRRVAQELVISPKTAGRHIENIYGKINVSSRAAAALFALQNDLLGE